MVRIFFQRASCMDNMTACGEPASSVCASAAYLPVSSSQMPISASQMSMDVSASIAMTSAIMPSSASIMASAWQSASLTPEFCNYTCTPGRIFCPSL